MSTTRKRAAKPANAKHTLARALSGTYDVPLRERARRRDIIVDIAPPPGHEGALVGRTVLQRAMRARQSDEHGFVVMAHCARARSPYYLTPDRNGGQNWWWLNGFDGQQWLHDAFSIFPTVEAAMEQWRKAPRDAHRLQLGRVVFRSSAIALVPTTYLRDCLTS